MSWPKILAIDDSSTDIELLRFALDRQGEEYELEVLQDGTAALQFIGNQLADLDKSDLISARDLAIELRARFDSGFYASSALFECCLSAI